MLFERGRRADYNVWWNVRFDAGCIFKPWAVERVDAWRENRRKLLRIGKEVALLSAAAATEGGWTKEGRGRLADLRREVATLETVEKFDTENYRVLWLGKKGFRITRKARVRRETNSVYFFDAMGFYSSAVSETAPLDGMARKYLGESKTAKDEGIDVVALGADVGYYEAHRAAIRRYCVHDANLTADLFRLTIRAFVNIGVAFPPHPWSKASVGKYHMERLGTLESTLETYAALRWSGHARFWENAYVGACIHDRALGSWTNVLRLDINSAYPHAMRTFPSLDGAVLVGSSDPRYRAAFFKFYEIDLIPTPRRALPSERGNMLYAHGGEAQRCVVAEPDLAALLAWGDPFRVRSSVGVHCPSKERPFEYMEGLFKSKTSIKEKFGDGSVEYENVKRMLVASYGVVVQRRPRESRFTNLIYGAYITAICRRDLWLMAQACERAGGTVLALMTDGLFVADLSPGQAPPSSKRLGEWGVDPVSILTLLGNGLYITDGKLKRRGAPHLTIDDLMAAEEPTVTTSREGPLGLKQAIVEARPAEAGIWTRREHTLAPARSAALAGLALPPGLLGVPIRDYFSRRWLLDYQTREAAERMALAIEAVAESSTED